MIGSRLAACWRLGRFWGGDCPRPSVRLDNGLGQAPPQNLAYLRSKCCGWEGRLRAGTVVVFRVGPGVLLTVRRGLRLEGRLRAGTGVVFGVGPGVLLTVRSLAVVEPAPGRDGRCLQGGPRRPSYGPA